MIEYTADQLNKLRLITDLLSSTTLVAADEIKRSNGDPGSPLLLSLSTWPVQWGITAKSEMEWINQFQLADNWLKQN